jgi:hypothetical protein
LLEETSPGALLELDLAVGCTLGRTPLAAPGPGAAARSGAAAALEAGIGDGWTPRELRTSFVSLMSHHGVSIEENARVVGHASTRTIEVVYRWELRPVITTGAEIIDVVFGN